MWLFIFKYILKGFHLHLKTSIEETGNWSPDKVVGRDKLYFINIIQVKGMNEYKFSDSFADRSTK